MTAASGPSDPHHAPSQDHPTALPDRLAALWRLAWPTIVARSGILLMALVDIVMVGRYSTVELGYASLGFALFVPVLVTGIGLVSGVVILTSQAFGAGRLSDCGVILRRALPWALCLGLGGAAVLMMGEPILRAFGQTDDLAVGGGEVARILALGVAAQIVFVVFAFHLEGTRRPLPGMVAMVVANFLNVGLNWVLIYGNLGAPEMGAAGSALATSAVRIFLLAALIAYVVWDPRSASFGVDRARFWGSGSSFWGAGGWRAGAQMRRFGFAAGAGYFVETTAYGSVMQFAGWLGAVELGAYTIAHNVEATCFMVALGVASATGVLVGGAVGRGDRLEAGRTGWLGVAVGVGTLFVISCLIWAFTDALAAVYTPDAALAAAAVTVLLLSGLTILFDGAQVILGHAVRAMGDAWVATGLYALAFWGGSAPLAYVFGVWLEGGAFGLLVGVSLGCVLAVSLFALRFRALCARTAAPIEGSA